MVWTKFLRWLLLTATGALGAVLLLVAAVDPYGNLGTGWHRDRVMLDVNQRFMYPQIARSHEFDAAIIGTSTSRLMPPAPFDAAFGARFAALAMNSATAWEQYRLADLFLEENPGARGLVIGLDVVWCDRDAQAGDTTKRGFPDWLYDDSRLDDFQYLLNMKAIEISGRYFGYLVGRETPRYGADGYGVFTPPEAEYDLERARGHIWGSGARKIVPADPPVLPDAAERAAWQFPALAWIEELFDRLPPDAARVLAFVPVHVAKQPRPASREAAVEAECKARVADIARRTGAVLVDYRFASPLTETDENFWDPLHVRLPIAERLARDIAAMAQGGPAAEDARILYRPN